MKEPKNKKENNNNKKIPHTFLKYGVCQIACLRANVLAWQRGLRANAPACQGAKTFLRANVPINVPMF